MERVGRRQDSTGARIPTSHFILLSFELDELIQKTQNNVTGGGKSVKINKGAHHKKDGFGGSGLRGGYGGDLDAVNVLDPLLVPVQDENCGTTGPDHDHKTDHIREGQQCCI